MRHTATSAHNHFSSHSASSRHAHHSLDRNLAFSGETISKPIQGRYLPQSSASLGNENNLWLIFLRQHFILEIPVHTFIYVIFLKQYLLLVWEIYRS